MPNMLAYFRSRFLKPSLNSQNKKFESDVMANKDLIKQQQEIEFALVKGKQAKRRD